ncbi:MAG: hypothetical protein AABY87_01225 [bacterium]
MKEILILLAPHWWAFKNRILRFDRALYFRTFFLVIFGGGFWGGSIILLGKALSRLQSLSQDAGRILTLKGLSLFILVSFFILMFSGMVTAISRFYLSQELPMMLSFPVSRGKIYAAKWIETLISASWMVLLFGIPVFFAFGLQFHVNVWYYPWLLFILTLFVAIPVGIGIWLAILLMSVIPARRGKALFVFLGFLIFGLLYMLVRFMRPERLINPEWFANLTMFLAEMQAPASPLLPSMWAAEALGPFFHTGEGTPLFYAVLLASTGAAMMVFGYWTFEALYAAGWLKAQEGNKAFFTFTETSVKHVRWFSVHGICRGLCFMIHKVISGVRRALFEKDILLFIRDEGQWSQIPLLVTLMVIYLFSIKALPLEWGTLVGLSIKYMVAFLNIGLVGIVMAAIAVRFLYPFVSMEGRAFWLLRTAPISIRTFLWNKFMIGFIPLFFLTLVLMGVSTFFLHVKVWMVILSTVTGAVLAASITGLSVGMGAIHPDFEAENLSQVSTGLRGTAYMLFALLLIFGTIALEAIPTIGIFLGEVSKGTLLPSAKVIIGLFFAAALLLNMLFLYLPMRIGERRLEGE